ncbi:hypothetical protein C8R46DRAFT_888383, partial [Mycena filopes]
RRQACSEPTAALATGCTFKVTVKAGSYDLRQNKALGDELAHIVRSKYGSIDYEWGIKSASTDFVTMPSLHPGFAIPTVPDGGNHTSGFAKSAAIMSSHYACLDVSKALAATGVRVVIDDHFYSQVCPAGYFIFVGSTSSCISGPKDVRRGQGCTGPHV